MWAASSSPASPKSAAGSLAPGLPSMGDRPRRHDPLHLLGPAVGRRAERARHHVDHRIGEGHGVVFGQRLDFLAGHALGEQVERHVADDLARGRHFDDVAEQLVDVGVHTLDLAPMMAEPHRFGLLLQVGELAARDLVHVDVGRAVARRVVERQVVGANGLPIERVVAERLLVEAGVARSVLRQSGDHRVEVRLRGRAAHRRRGAVDDVGAGLGGSRAASPR